MRYWNVKSSQRQKLSNKISQRIKEIQRTDPEPVEHTGREILSVLVGLDKLATATEEESTEPKKEIILYLREGVSPASKNYTKYPNDIHTLLVERLKDMSEGILYIYFWRESWGWGRNYCRSSHQKIYKNTLLGSTKTAKRAVESLVKKKFIIKGLIPSLELDVNRQGTLYRVLTPDEIYSEKTEEGILLKDIPESGVVMISMDIKSIDVVSTGHNVHGLTGGNTLDIKSIDIMSTDQKNSDASSISGIYGHNVHRHNVQPLKEKNKDKLKNTLSHEEIISHFYECVGQKKITKAKRERANECLGELIREGFSLEDIHFAIEWTIRNSKEKPYEFSILKHTISQAVADKEKLEAENKRRQEQEQIAIQAKAEDERLEKEREEIEAFKERLSSEEKTNLRQRALAEIEKMEGVKKEFVTDVLIKVKENEILKAEMDSRNRNQ